MGLATAAVGLVGSAFSAMGAAQSGAATAASDQYQAQVAENNAVIAKQNATAEMAAGEIAGTDSGLQTRSKLGNQTATMGANGIDVNTGSSAAVRAGTDQTGMLDALTIRSNSARRAYGYLTQSTSDEAQAGLDRMGASNAEESGDLGAATSLITGASSVGRAYSSYQNSVGNYGIG